MKRSTKKSLVNAARTAVSYGLRGMAPLLCSSSPTSADEHALTILADAILPPQNKQAPKTPGCTTRRKRT